MKYENQNYYWVKLKPDMDWEVACYVSQYPGFFLTSDSNLYNPDSFYKIIPFKIEKPKL